MEAICFFVLSVTETRSCAISIALDSRSCLSLSISSGAQPVQDPVDEAYAKEARQSTAGLVCRSSWILRGVRDEFRSNG